MATHKLIGTNKGPIVSKPGNPKRAGRKNGKK